MEIFAANSQWSTRPADQRFETLEKMYEATKGYADVAQEKVVSWDDLRVEADGPDVVLIGKAKIPARLSHWAFGQLCERISAPASYLRRLPATLASQNINHGFANRVAEYGEDAEAKLMFHANGGLLLRALTGVGYERIWNHEVLRRLLDLQARGWEPARPDLRFDGGDPLVCQMCGGSAKTADGSLESRSFEDDASCKYCAGTGRAFPALYASDKDMFAFIRNRSSIIREPGNPDGLQRGIIYGNSEVGDCSLWMMRFLYRAMCGNHIIWDAKRVVSMRVRHVGNVRDRFSLFAGEVKRYAEESASFEEAKIASAKSTIIAGTKDEVLDKLFGMKSISLSRKVLVAGYDAVNPDQDGDPNSVWGMVQGLTRHSQTVPFADDRTAIDVAAGKILEANF